MFLDVTKYVIKDIRANTGFFFFSFSFEKVIGGRERRFCRLKNIPSPKISNPPKPLDPVYTFKLGKVLYNFCKNLAVTDTIFK